MTTLTGDLSAIAKPALWRRLSAYQMTRLLIVATAIATTVFVLNKLFKLSLFDFMSKPVKNGVAIGLMVLVYAIYVRLVEQRKVSELAWRSGLKQLVTGFLTGAVIFSAIVAGIAALGGYQITGMNSASVMLGSLYTFFFVAVFEEVISRAVVFRIIEASLGSWLALLISAALFGLAHIFNPGATWFSSLSIAIEAGILLGAAFMLTRNLGFCVGIHWAWNFMQGAVFSIAVSGTKTEGWLQASSKGPVWLTGGEFGAEASLVALVLATLAGFLILAMAIKRGQLVLPFWQRKA